MSGPPPHAKQQGCLRLLCGLWLTLGLPVFGVMPVLYFLYGFHLNHELVWLWWAILRELAGLFVADPAPDVDHVPPPLTPAGWAVMVVVAGMLSGAALWYLWHSGPWARAAVSDRGPSSQDLRL